MPEDDGSQESPGIRPERDTDYPAVRALVSETHRLETARLVDLLRMTSSYVSELALVACLEDAVVGHIMVSRITLRGDRDWPVLCLAPLSVEPRHQNAGIGSALVRAACQEADALGESLIFVLGHKTYYPRFGFQSGRSLGVTAPAEWQLGDEDFWMALPLTGYSPDITGLPVFPHEFIVTKSLPGLS